MKMRAKGKGQISLHGLKCLCRDTSVLFFIGSGLFVYNLNISIVSGGEQSTGTSTTSEIITQIQCIGSFTA